MASVYGSCGTGIHGTGPLPGDPDGNISLHATPAFAGINVSWTYPTTNASAVAHTILYRGTSSNFSSAIQHRIVTGNFFYDQISIAQIYYYWIEVVSINGTVGSLIGPASAVAAGLTTDILQTLTGQIDSGLLAQSLKADIDRISLLGFDITTEVTAREDVDLTFAQALADVEAGIASAATFINTINNSRVSDNAAIAESVDLLAVTLGDEVASVVVNTGAWINEVTGDIGAMYTARLTANGLVGGFGLINDGASVDAGFDVDTFWIGRTNNDKVKPFIVSGGNVYIDNAHIRNITADKLSVGNLADISTTFTGNTSGNVITSGQVKLNGNFASTGYGGTALDVNGGKAANNGIVTTSGGSGGSALLATANGIGTGIDVRHLGGGPALNVTGRTNLSGDINITTQTISNLTAGNSNKLGNVSASSYLRTNATAADSNELGGVPSSQWARTFPGNTGIANAAGAGLNINITGSLSATVRTRGTSNFMYIENISDENLKTNIHPEYLGLDFITSIEPKTFEMKSNPGVTCHGVIAQDMQKLLNNANDNLVQINGDDTLGFDYNGIVSPLIKSIQELKEMVTALQEEVNNLKKQHT